MLLRARAPEGQVPGKEGLGSVVSNLDSVAIWFCSNLLFFYASRWATQPPLELD